MNNNEFRIISLVVISFLGFIIIGLSLQKNRISKENTIQKELILKQYELISIDDQIISSQENIINLYKQYDRIYEN
jgi:hypothetical protein